MIRKRLAQISVFALASLLALQALPPVAGLAASPTQRSDDPSVEPSDDSEYIRAIQRTADMVFEPQVQALADEYGLNLINVTWEDTGRYKDSSVGPNISDVTIQVMHRDPESRAYQLSLMPVIRYPNFSDLTADISPDHFFVLVGNEKGQDLRKISLRQYLGDLRAYLHDGRSWTGARTSLLADRDSHVLVSAQAAFLPVPQEGLAQFNPVIFNYQSYQGDPAVLVLVATREGTSATVVDNVRDAFPAGFSWGQRLFFNQDGERASFTGERLSDFNAENPRPGEDPERGGDGPSPQAGGESGLNMVLVIQVPLKQREPFMRYEVMEEGLTFAAPQATAKSNVENAVIGHGRVEGPFTEIDGLDIERDDRFPIRVTVQFYKATSNGVVTEEDMRAIAEQIERVYQQADYVGSLVVEGETGRPTEYEGPKEEPPGWWESFWQRFEDDTDLSRDQALDLWQRLRMRARGWWVDLRK